MTVPNLTFSALFTNQTAFPTGAHGGRAELQLLHDETKNFINDELIPFIAQTSDLDMDGYVKLPSGLIIQWGGATITAGSNTLQVVNLPIPFPNGIFRLAASCVSLNSFGGAVRGDNLSTVKIWSNNNGAAIEYFAIGY